MPKRKIIRADDPQLEAAQTVAKQKVHGLKEAIAVMIAERASDMNIRQIEVSEMTDISQSDISRMIGKAKRGQENLGVKTRSVETLLMILERLGVDAEISITEKPIS